MNLIHEIEISYFRSFYKFRIFELKDINIIFGKNDSGKSNLVRALNLFFEGTPDPHEGFEFPIDFCESRAKEAEDSEDVRKFLYVKVTFNTPPSYQRSLGKRFYVKRQWTITRDDDYIEEYSSHILKSQRHIVTRFLNKIRFMYIPAIKDIRIFEYLLSAIHETIAESDEFVKAVTAFSSGLQNLTKDMFARLPRDISSSTKIGAPTRLAQLFETLDFETTSEEGSSPKSLTRQRGDGIKVRHIPELLNFISANDGYEYHVWGFEEPENSLDFAASQSEANRMKNIAQDSKIQIILTTHSPSFYLLDGSRVAKFYVSKGPDGNSIPTQGKELAKFSAQEAIGEGFYLPAVAKSLQELAEIEARARLAEEAVSSLQVELSQITAPVVLTEGRTDASILLTAWTKLRGGVPPFSIRTCETGGEQAGSGNGGAQQLAIRLKGVAHDHPHAVIGLFDYDNEGIDAFKLDRNFVDVQSSGFKFKRALFGKAYAFCLIPPEFRDECGRYKNMPIEFMFPDEALEIEVAGSKLRLAPKKASTKIGDEKVEVELDNFTHFKDVKGGKSEFAKYIVPSLDKSMFIGFETTFLAIEAILSFHLAK